MTTPDTQSAADSVNDDESRELHIGENGLWIPPEIRGFEKQVVFRTPRATIQHFGSGDLEPYYGMIDATHFGQEDEMDSLQNPELLPNTVSIKEQGQPAKTFPVNTDPDVKL